MTICKWEGDNPNRSDDYIRDGHSACCSKANCLKYIGKKKYYQKEIGGGPAEFIKKY